MASLATFVSGLVAVRTLGSAALAGYALLFSSFLIASQFPAELIYSPSQVLAIDLPSERRLAMLRHSSGRGLLLSSASAFIVPLGLLPILGQIPGKEAASLAISASLLAIVSPLQDHMRSMFHLANSSWMAAATSAIHFAGTSISLIVLWRLSPLLAPFGALLVGNVVSIAFAATSVVKRRLAGLLRPTFGELRDLGGWLLTTGVARSLLGYATRSVLTSVVGITALGHVEGARIVSQPVYVLASGLSAQVGPRSTEAAAKQDQESAMRWRWRFRVLFALVALPYATVVAFPSSINPFVALAPRAYEIPGLTAVTLIGVLLNSLPRPLKSEMLGARLQKQLAYLTIALGLVEVGLVFLGYRIGAFAVPVGLAVTAVLMLAVLSWLLESFYRPAARLPR